MKKTIDVQSIVTAYDGTVSAYGALKKAVQDAFKGCKTAEQYKARRVAVYAGIDGAITDAEKAKAVKASVNSTLARILPEGMKLGERKGGRKAQPARKASKQASTSKQAPAAPALHDMTSLLAAITAMAEKASKQDCVAMRDRIANQFATIIAKK